MDLPLVREGDRQGQAAAPHHGAAVALPAARVRHAHEDVHARSADEPRDELVGRALVDVGGRAHLAQAPLLHHGDAPSHRHRLDLVVCHIDHRGAELAVQLQQLGAQLRAQLGVEVGKWLVEEKEPRLAHDRATERHALALAAGEVRGPAIEQVAHSQALGGRCHATRDVALRDPPHLERERDVLAHGEVRVQRIILEDHRDVTLRRRVVGNDPVADEDFPGRRLFQAGDAPQRRRLAAPRGAQQHQELPIGHHERDVSKRVAAGGVEGLGQLAEGDRRHAA